MSIFHKIEIFFYHSKTKIAQKLQLQMNKKYLLTIHVSRYALSVINMFIILAIIIKKTNRQWTVYSIGMSILFFKTILIPNFYHIFQEDENSSSINTGDSSRRDTEEVSICVW